MKYSLVALLGLSTTCSVTSVGWVVYHVRHPTGRSVGHPFLDQTEYGVGTDRAIACSELGDCWIQSNLGAALLIAPPVVLTMLTLTFAVAAFLVWAQQRRPDLQHRG
jgi:hypothetical protein